MRRSTQLLLFFLAAGACVIGSFVDASVRREHAAADLQLRARLVRELGLTDLALFTEARYIRHLSQADLHTPFQDHPMALEHFPSGSIQPPPRWLLQ